MHRYIPPGVEEGTPIQDTLSQPLSIDGPNATENGPEAETSPFEKYDPLLHIGLQDRAKPNTRGKKKRQDAKKEVLTMAFIKKYIQYAKSKPQPTLTVAAADTIVEAYATLRNEDEDNNRKRVSDARYVYRLEVLLTAIVHCRFLTDLAIDRSYARDAHPSLRRACQSSVVHGSDGRRRGDRSRDPPFRALQRSHEA